MIVHWGCLPLSSDRYTVTMVTPPLLFLGQVVNEWACGVVYRAAPKLLFQHAVKEKNAQGVVGD